MLDILERQQVWIYCAAISLAAITGFAVSGTSELEGAINPALAFMLLVTFLQVSLPEIGRGIRGARFLCTLLVSNFIAVPILAVLLAPCIDYVITVAQLGLADARLLPLSQSQWSR